MFFEKTSTEIFLISFYVRRLMYLSKLMNVKVLSYIANI